MFIYFILQILAIREMVQLRKLKNEKYVRGKLKEIIPNDFILWIMRGPPMFAFYKWNVLGHPWVVSDGELMQGFQHREQGSPELH